jgi:thiamine-phosphate pyrophosphorylase
MLRYAITDRSSFPGNEASQQNALLEQATSLAANNIDFFQLREKDLKAGALVDLARKIQTIFRTHSNHPKLLINSRADIAIATQADGVHLTAAPGSLTPSQIRALYAAANLPDPIVSVSCHTLAEVTRARDEAATLILFGPVFEKVISHEPVATGSGLDLLQTACALAVPIQVLALGGITQANASACMAAGAAGIAAIRLFLNFPTVDLQPPTPYA